MSASMTAPQRIDGFEKLLILATLNKDTIAAAANEERKQLELTNEKRATLAAAEARIAQAAKLDADMQQREAALEAGKVQLDLDRKQHIAHVASENTRLEAFSAKLDAKNKQSEELAARIEKEKDTFAGLKIDHERQHRELIASCQKQEALNTSAAQANAAKEQTLNDREASLKRKAELIRQQMATL